MVGDFSNYNLYTWKVCSLAVDVCMLGPNFAVSVVQRSTLGKAYDLFVVILRYRNCGIS